MVGVRARVRVSVRVSVSVSVRGQPVPSLHPELSEAA